VAPFFQAASVFASCQRPVFHCCQQQGLSGSLVIFQLTTRQCKEESFGKPSRLTTSQCKTERTSFKIITGDDTAYHRNNNLILKIYFL